MTFVGSTSFIAIFPRKSYSNISFGPISEKVTAFGVRLSTTSITWHFPLFR
nr:MAG TPA: hypothetical protein [Caudoviricetes sp.]